MRIQEPFPSRRAIAACLGALVLAVSTGARAGVPPHSAALEHCVASGLQRAQAMRTLPPPWLDPAPQAAFDLVALDQDLSLDPATGMASGSISVVLRGAAGGASFQLLLDEGLSVGSVSSPTRTVTTTAATSSPYALIEVEISPPLAAGEEALVVVPLSGTLACAGEQCGLSGELDFFRRGSALPYFVDPAAPFGVDDYDLSIVLHTPADLDVLVSADLVDDATAGEVRTTSWSAPSMLSSADVLLVSGDFGRIDVPTTEPPVVVHFLADDPAWSEEMASWSQKILPFLEARAGVVLPYEHLDTVKLPPLDGFPGTATRGVTFLADSYAQVSAEFFEEDLAHEHAHQYWGVLLFPTDPSYWLVEGLALMVQYDYTAATYYADQDRDLYLAQRYRWNALSMRYLTDPATVPALVPDSWNDAPTTSSEYTTWAYFKSSATLDHLRLLLGDEPFSTGLRQYTAACLGEPCSTADFRSAMEDASGLDLGSFFEQWVYATNYPRVAFGFRSEDPSGSSITVEATQDGALEIPIELWLELENGKVEHHPVVLGPGTSSFAFDASGPVRTVRPNPRHDAIVWTSSMQVGDASMDAEVDGRDLVRCARLFGLHAVDPDGPDSVWSVEMAFDPRCDLVEDGVIDDADLALVLDHFAERLP